MDTLLGLLGLAVIVAIVYGFTALKDKAVGSAVGAVNRKVQAGTHAEGLAYADTQYFYAIDAPGPDVIAALVSGVKAADSAPLIGIGSTYRERVSDAQVTWAHGTKVQDAFRAQAALVTATTSDGEQRGVVLHFSDLTTVDGVVAEVGAMRALRHDVFAALRTVDPSVQETELAWQ